MRPKLSLEFGMGLMLLEPHKSQGDDTELGVAKMLANLLHGLVELVQAGGAVDVWSDRNDQLAGGVEHVHVDQAHRRRGVDDARIIQPFDALERGP